MAFDFTDFEMPLLQAIVKLGGKAKTKDVYPEVEKIIGLTPAKFPEEYEAYQKGQIKWKNKTAWGREYLKRKGQLAGTERGVWKITEMERDRAEFEYKSSSFKAHNHTPSQCDIVICWEHDWADCPLEVLCLKDIVNKYK